MEDDYLTSFNELDNHWWRCGRREIIAQLVTGLELPRSTAIDVGCGNGDILKSLQAKGVDGFGIDTNSDGISAARSRGLSAAVCDATTLACPSETFGLLIASDVLEHIPEEKAAVSEWHRILAPGGYAIVFVPAFEWLWCSHDELNNHQRRYTVSRLREALETVGFEIKRTSYWNLSTSPVAVPVKLLDKLLWTGEPQVRETSTVINKLLSSLLQTENWIIDKRLDMPFGTSAFVIARRPQ